MKEDYNADVFLFSYKDGQEKADEILKEVKKENKYDAIIVGIHNYANKPLDNFNISPAASEII